jgi:hypothetical protein
VLRSSIEAAIEMYRPLWLHMGRGLGAYTEHYNRARPHRALALHPPGLSLNPENMPGRKVYRRDVLGGLIHEYHRNAA